MNACSTFQLLRNSIELEDLIRRDFPSGNMKSAFGSKRKARKIQVDEDDEDGAKNVNITEPVNTRKYPEAITATSPADGEKLADHNLQLAQEVPHLQSQAERHSKSPLCDRVLHSTINRKMETMGMDRRLRTSLQ